MFKLIVLFTVLAAVSAKPAAIHGGSTFGYRYSVHDPIIARGPAFAGVSGIPHGAFFAATPAIVQGAKLAATPAFAHGVNLASTIAHEGVGFATGPLLAPAPVAHTAPGLGFGHFAHTPAPLVAPAPVAHTAITAPGLGFGHFAAPAPLVAPAQVAHTAIAAPGFGFEHFAHAPALGFGHFGQASASGFGHFAHAPTTFAVPAFGHGYAGRYTIQCGGVDCGLPRTKYGL